MLSLLNTAAAQALILLLQLGLVPLEVVRRTEDVSLYALALQWNRLRLLLEQVNRPTTVLCKVSNK